MQSYIIVNATYMGGAKAEATFITQLRLHTKTDGFERLGAVDPVLKGKILKFWVQSSLKIHLKAAWIWLVNAPGVKRPAMGVAPM